MLAIRQREVKRIIRMNKRLWEKEKVNDIGKNRKNNTRMFFEKAKKVRRSFKPRTYNYKIGGWDSVNRK